VETYNEMLKRHMNEAEVVYFVFHTISIHANLRLFFLLTI